MRTRWYAFERRHLALAALTVLAAAGTTVPIARTVGSDPEPVPSPAPIPTIIVAPAEPIPASDVQLVVRYQIRFTPASSAAAPTIITILPAEREPPAEPCFPCLPELSFPP